MLPIGMLLAWAGYGFGTWGYILVKGHNISLREWFSPLHPYTGTLWANDPIPKGRLWPPGAKGGGNVTTPAADAAVITSGPPAAGGSTKQQPGQTSSLKQKPLP